MQVTLILTLVLHVLSGVFLGWHDIRISSNGRNDAKQAASR